MAGRKETPVEKRHSVLEAENARLRAEVQGLRADLKEAEEMTTRVRRERDLVRADLKLACVWLRDFDGDWSAAALERELRAWTDDSGRPRPTGEGCRPGARERDARREIKRLEGVIEDLRGIAHRLEEERDAVNQQAWLRALAPMCKEQVEVEDEIGAVRVGFLFFSKREVMVDDAPLVLLSGLRLVEADCETPLEIETISRISRRTPHAVPASAPADDEPIPF